VCHVVSVTDPYDVILGFLDLNRYFFPSSSVCDPVTRDNVDTEHAFTNKIYLACVWNILKVLVQ
jgi:hypothetical protein